MGFGICVIGCIALVTDIIGGGIVAYPLLAYGMKKASTLNVNFFYAAVAALFCIPHSALVLFSFLGVIDENTVFYQASYRLFYAIYLLFHIFFLPRRFAGLPRGEGREIRLARDVAAVYDGRLRRVGDDASAVPVHQQRGHRGRAANL